MPEDIIIEEPVPFEPVPCSLGLWTGIEGDTYLITQPSGQVVGVRANGDLSADNIEADIASPKPNDPGPVVLTPLQLLGRLTPAEEATLAASTEMAVMVVRNRLLSASEIRSDDPRTAQGAAILVDAGIITAERAAEIFPL